MRMAPPSIVSDVSSVRTPNPRRYRRTRRSSACEVTATAVAAVGGEMPPGATALAARRGGRMASTPRGGSVSDPDDEPPDAFPVRSASLRGRGIGLVAARALGRGEAVLRAAPLAAVPAGEGDASTLWHVHTCTRTRSRACGVPGAVERRTGGVPYAAGRDGPQSRGRGDGRLLRTPGLWSQHECIALRMSGKHTYGSLKWSGNPKGRCMSGRPRE